jgi:uncharacterized membrane protein (UPF0127 family)
MTGLSRSWVFLFILLLAGLKAVDARAEVLFERSTVTIETQQGSKTLAVEVADTDPKRAQGLMFRRSLPANQGMLFLFDTNDIISMWMKNTYISLDMVFIGADWRIVSIAEKTEPFSLDIVSSAAPAMRVIEIAAGQAAVLGLKPGDRVRYPG